jgi:hypothetical protein
LLVPREQVARIERLMLPPRGTHPTYVWGSELHVRKGAGLVPIAIQDHELEVRAGFESALRAWHERGLAPQEAA